MPSNKPSGGPSDHQRRSAASKESEGDVAPSSTLWVGSLSSATDDSDLMAVFSKQGALDCTTMTGVRSYSFLYFRTPEEAKAAEDALQGTSIKGSMIRIEFARPAKSAKQIWVGGLGSSISKEQLENEFLKFGKIQDYKFFKDRHSAIIEYCKLQDAIMAHKTMNGKCLAGEQIRIDFVRFQPPRKDWPDLSDSSRGQFSYDMRGFHEFNNIGSKRHMPPGGRKDGPPSNVLWIGYPPSVHVDEQLLHNAMILFGEIEKIRCFPSSHCSFVEFRSVDEARRAKEGLEGRLFNDSRIQILFLSSDFAPKDNLAPFLGVAPSELFVNENPFGSFDPFRHGLPVARNSFPRHLHPIGLLGSSALIRPFGLQGLDPRHSGLEIQDISGAPHNFLDDADASKSLPPTLGHRSSSALLPHLRCVPDERDGFDMRESKRTRADGSMDGFPNIKRYDGSILDHTFGQLQTERGAFRSRLGPAVREVSSPGTEYRWCGIIAKGGNHVCYARCIPIGKGFNCSLSHVVNCSARTELDKLTEHCAEAVGFDIVFFLPDSEKDFASYTEFLHYLGSKSRAGIAKLDDGTTLFLVPPSNFLTKVLKVNGPERLYGVVLKFLQESTSSLNRRQETASQYSDRMDLSNPQNSYPFLLTNEIQASKVDYDQSLHGEGADHSIMLGKPLPRHSDLQYASQSSKVLSHSISIAAPKSVSLMPESMATMGNSMPSGTQPTLRVPTSSASVVNSAVPYPVGEEHSISSVASFDLPVHLPSHLGEQNMNQVQPSIFAVYGNLLSNTDPVAQPINPTLSVQNASMGMPQIPTLSHIPLTNYGTSQTGQLSGMPSHNNYLMSQATNAPEGFTLAVQQQPSNTSLYDQMGNLPQSQVLAPLPTERSTLGFVAQVPQVQTVLPGSEAGSSQSEADKNQRYQSTLQLAAKLLLQVQQQQQSKNNAAQASGKQP